MITQKFTLTLPEKHKNRLSFPIYNSPTKFSAKFTLKVEKNETKNSWEIVSKNITKG